MLLDTNVLIYASDAESPHRKWAWRTIADAVASEGAAVNAVTLADLCVSRKREATAFACRGVGHPRRRR